ncbi:Benomyl methotrexate resistance protein [Neofusicoccum parvum]|uniref:Benomyl methotrexate resistance protein n=1 Tax=Neofusicoccum parvum TaxID=310453 RepID=A0ACB5SKB7_9PEZI|nr:Benomyl methotrexate resistance protein [Neofusicoccum parvum]
MDPIVEYPIAASADGRPTPRPKKPVETPHDSGSSRNSIDHDDVEKKGDQYLDAAQTQAPSPLDWDGPDDPDNPHNWSYLKRGCITLAVGLIGFTVTLGSSVYTPALSEVVQKFNISTTVALLGLSLYTIGLGFGPVLAAPISEIFGRNVVYRTSIPVSALFTLGAGFSNSFASFLVCRFFAGFFAGPVLAVGAGTSADMYPERMATIGVTSFVMWPFAGPSLGPFIGGFVVQYKTWRWTQWVILFGMTFVYILLLFIPETYKKAILKKRAKRRNTPLPPKTGPQGTAAIKFLLTVTLLRPLHMLATEPIVTCISVYVAFVFAVLFSFFEAFPIVFEGVYGFDTVQTGLTFLAVGLGVLLAGATAVFCDFHFYQPEYRRAMAAGETATAPEFRLYVSMMGSVGVPVGVFWFAWSARESVHWASCLVAAVPFAWGNLSIFIGTSQFIVQTYGPLTGASAIAANGIARYTISAAFPLFTIQMYQKLGIDWATSLLGFISLAMLPIPWVLFKWGPKIRAKSKYDTVNA